MFQDEARFGRMNRPMRCWAPAGYRPVVGKQLVREYVYAFCAASPADGICDFLILPTLEQKTMQLFLNEVSARHANELVLMFCDGASAHNDKGLKLPENMLLVKLPPYCPDLNPIEHIWDDMREKFFGNLVFKSIDAVEAQITTACQFYDSSPEVAQSITGFEWIVKPI
jgi:hypothetical protein